MDTKCGDVIQRILDISHQIIPNYHHDLHYMCRSGDINYPITYPIDTPTSDKLFRPYVPDEKVLWICDSLQYAPIEYTSPRVLSKLNGTDSNDTGTIKFNCKDEKVDRVSRLGTYAIDDHSGRPMNPAGRTGITGRGILDRWGPNHVINTIITRWKRDEEGILCRSPDSGNPILEFVAIYCPKSNSWTIPQAVRVNESEETIERTLICDSINESYNSIEDIPSSYKLNENGLYHYFNSANKLYEGYADDPRNTDNAWIETTVSNFHDEDGKILNEIKLRINNNATDQITWLDINKKVKFYPTHRNLIQAVALLLEAHW